MPTQNTNFGNVAFGLRVRMYQRVTSANRGPDIYVNTVCRHMVVLHTGGQRNKDHEDGAFWIAVANG